MALTVRALTILAYANNTGFNLWHYRAGTDRLDDVGAAGYFTPAWDMLRAGDMILVSAQDGGRVLIVARSGQGADVLTSPLS